MNKTAEKRFWPALLALQCLVLLVLMWKAPAALLLDKDAAKLYTHTAEMVHSGSVLIPGWHYQTSLELDCAALPALPLYALTGDILLSFRLADTLLLAAAVAFLLWLLRRLGAGRDTACLGTLLVLLPYGFGTLEYWNMLFLNGCQYIFKVFVPLALAGLLLPVPSRRPRGHWFGLAAVLALTALCSFSSGSYLFLCGLFPVLAWQAWCLWDQKQKPGLYTAVLWLGTLAAAAGGFAAGRLAGVYNHGDGTLLTAAAELPGNVLACLTGIFSLFGAVGTEPTAALSAAGIGRLLRLLFVLCLLAALFAAARAAGRSAQDGRSFLAAIALWNLLILCITNTSYGQVFEYRYHLIGMVPVLLLFALALPNLRPSLRAVALAGVLALTVFVDGAAARATAPAVLADVNTREAAEARALVAAVAALDEPVQTVCVEYYTSLTEVCRTLDPARRYVTWSPADGTLASFDYYLTDLDAAAHAGPCLYALYSGAQPPAGARPVGEGAGFVFYLQEEGTPDGVTGFVAGDRMVDWPNSPAYTFDGTVDEQRRLHAVGTAAVPWVVRSPTLTLYTMTDITLDYTAAGGAPGQLELWVGEEQLFTVPLDGSAPQASLSGIAPGEYILKVSLPEGAAATLGPITFTPSGQ